MKNSIDEEVQKEHENLQEALRWWSQQSKEFKSEYKGKWIGVGEKQVVASYSLDELGKLAKEKGIEVYFTTYIEDDDEYHAFTLAV